MIKYHPAPDIDERIKKIISVLSMNHIKPERIRCLRSTGSGSRGTLARCHGLSRAFQAGLGIKSYYVIEVVSEHFDKLSKEEQDKTLIHELMHIPKAFRGGFRHHSNYVTKKEVERVYKIYIGRAANS